MNVEIKKEKINTFPKLMSDRDIIILFTSAGVGTVIGIINKTSDNIGDYAPDWDSSLFSDYEGSVTLSN